MNGKRVDGAVPCFRLQPGEYGKDPQGRWYAHCPNDQHLIANLGKHDVVEHEDGTITVSPSILCERAPGETWHGWLERGVWRSA